MCIQYLFTDGERNYRLRAHLRVAWAMGDVILFRPRAHSFLVNMTKEYVDADQIYAALPSFVFLSCYPLLPSIIPATHNHPPLYV